MEGVRKAEIELLEMKTTLPEVKNPLDGINSKLDIAEESVSDLGTQHQ